MLQSPVFRLEDEPDPFRLTGLPDNSGVRDTGRDDMRMWVAERQFRGRWTRDEKGLGHVFLPNSATWRDALKRFRLDGEAKFASSNSLAAMQARLVQRWASEHQGNEIDDWLHRGGEEEEEDPTTEKAAMDWEEYAKPTAPSPVWRNYNTIGPRRFITTLIQVLESRLPATWYITEDPNEIARMKKKWGGKGHPFNARGVKGMRIQYRGYKMFLGMLAGKEVAVRQTEFQP